MILIITSHAYKLQPMYPQGENHVKNLYQPIPRLFYWAIKTFALLRIPVMVRLKK
jgi:hypothetical protein